MGWLQQSTSLDVASVPPVGDERGSRTDDHHRPHERHSGTRSASNGRPHRRQRRHALGSRQPDAGAQAQRWPRARRPQQDRARGRAACRNAAVLDGVDPMRVATKTISGLYDGATTTRARRAVDPDRGRARSPRSRSTPSSPRACWRRTSTRRCANQEIHAFSQSIAVGARARASINAGIAELRRRQRAQAERRDRPRARPAFEYFGLRTLYDRYLLRAPGDAARDRDAAAVLPAHRVRAVDGGRRGARALPAVLVARVPPGSPTLFNAGTTPRAAVELLPARLAATTPRGDLRALHRRRAAVEVLRRHRPRLPPRALARLADRGTNGQSNGIVPWLKTLDSSVVGRQPGRQAQGRRCVYLEPWHADIEEFLELRDNTGDEARRTHNLNLANWIPDLFMRARRERLRRGRCSIPRRCPTLADLYGEAFERGVRRGRERRACCERRCQARDALRADDAHARADRQRLDDVQGRVQPRVQPDRRTPRRRVGAPVEPVHRDPRGHRRRRDGGVQPRLDQPRPHVMRDADGNATAFDFASSRARCAHGGAPARSRDRSQLLPDRRRPRVERALASGRARRDGPAGRVLPAAPAVRRRRGARAVDARSPRRSTSTRCRRRSSWPRSTGRTPPSPRRARRGASCSSTRGA